MTAMRDPRINPQAGDYLAKVKDRRVHSRTVISVVADVICYTSKRVKRWCSREEWRKWAKGTTAQDFWACRVAVQARHDARLRRFLRRQMLRDGVPPLAKPNLLAVGVVQPRNVPVLEAHEFAHRLLAGPNKRIVLIVPSFDAPGVAVACAPCTGTIMVEGVECLVIKPQKN